MKLKWSFGWCSVRTFSFSFTNATFHVALWFHINMKFKRLFLSNENLIKVVKVENALYSQPPPRCWRCLSFAECVSSVLQEAADVMESGWGREARPDRLCTKNSSSLLRGGCWRCRGCASPPGHTHTHTHTHTELLVNQSLSLTEMIRLIFTHLCTPQGTRPVWAVRSKASSRGWWVRQEAWPRSEATPSATDGEFCWRRNRPPPWPEVQSNCTRHVWVWWEKTKQVPYRCSAYLCNDCVLSRYGLFFRHNIDRRKKKEARECTCCCTRCSGRAVQDGEGGASSWLLLIRRHSKLNVGLLDAEKANKNQTYDHALHSNAGYRQKS